MTAVLDGFQLTQVDNQPKSKQHNLVFLCEVSEDFDRFERCCQHCYENNKEK
jgi:hypothetical protein